MYLATFDPPVGDDMIMRVPKHQFSHLLESVSLALKNEKTLVVAAAFTTK
jgi:hypothetical protein